MSEFWAATLEETVRSSERLARIQTQTRDVAGWLEQYTDAAPTSSNSGSANVPFQRWFHFKEAFSPKFVTDTLSSLPYQVNRCLDPFAGSGTTAVTCRMLGIGSVGVEVNPFLVDLIEAKLSPLPAAEFCLNYEKLISSLDIDIEDEVLSPGMPLTLVEPGKNGRFVFNLDVYRTARAILRKSQKLEPQQARLLRVLLGSVLVTNSNVTINGKGRRYRSNWQERKRSGSDLISSLDAAVDTAIADLTKFSGLSRGEHVIYYGDSRTVLTKVTDADVAIFSPPYPNSFDYTDVYNLELWMLGYLNSSIENMVLRHSTVRSHVQTKWATTAHQASSARLNDVLEALRQKRVSLWNKNIPEMVAFYFDDLWTIFNQLSRILKQGHHAVVAIGDSQYADVHIDVATILTESIASLGFQMVERGSIRSMRNSSQHGGGFELSESCLVFERST
ncbi:MAG: DNA methyltransferase [Candidatus Accumulibacter sp. UW25]|jgi:hypothetical protein